MISSTARDLPEHRQKIMDACMGLGMFYPDMMEHLTATDANALEVSLRIVDRADLYVGVFAFRYGYVPEVKGSRSLKLNTIVPLSGIFRDCSFS